MNVPKRYWYRVPTSITCYGCRELKPADQFAVDNEKASGRKSLCRECHRARERERYAARKQVA